MANDLNPVRQSPDALRVYLDSVAAQATAERRQMRYNLADAMARGGEIPRESFVVLDDDAYELVRELGRRLAAQRSRNQVRRAAAAAMRPVVTPPSSRPHPKRRTWCYLAITVVVLVTVAVLVAPFRH